MPVKYLHTAKICNYSEFGKYYYYYYYYLQNVVIFYVIGVKLILNNSGLCKNEMLYGCKQKGRHHARRGAFTGCENSVSDATGTP